MVYSFAWGLLVGCTWRGSVGRTRPTFSSMYLSFWDSGQGSSGGFLGEGTLRVESRSWGESKEEEGKLFRLFKASARKIIIIIKLLPGCAIGCVCPHSKGITQPHLKSVRWGRMLHLLEAMAKAKKEWFIDIPYVNKCNQRAQNPVEEVHCKYWRGSGQVPPSPPPPVFHFGMWVVELMALETLRAQEKLSSLP